MSFGHALYYPHINLSNKNWIKHALLFWDSISRIVPQSIEPSDGEDIIKIKYESEFIKDYIPERWDTTSTFLRFSEDLLPMLESERYFHERFLQIARNRRNHLIDYRDRRNFFTDIVETSGSYIHIEKIHSDLKNYLFEIGLAIPGRNEWESWVKIDNEIGFLYMTYFAKTISMRKSLPIVTDIEQSFSASIYFDSLINLDYNNQFEYKIGNLLIETIVPKNINNVPLDKILEIRNKYDDERTLFFNEISNLSSTIPTIDNADALKDVLNQQSKIILKETKNLEKLYNSYRIETANKFLTVSVPSTLASLSEYIPNQAKPLLAAGGLLFGLVSAANAVKRDKLELNNNPKSYLLNLKSELSGENLFNKVNDTIKGIRKW